MSLRKPTNSDTFNFCDPNPPTEPNHHLLKKSSSSLYRPVDRYDISGGAFPIKPDCSCSGKQYDDSNYSSNFLRTQVYTQNPATLCALKNTKMIKKILHEPEIKTVPINFIHRPDRSTSFLRMPTKYYTAVCKITENLRKNDQNSYFYNYKNRKLNATRFSQNPEELENVLKSIKSSRLRKQASSSSSSSGIFAPSGNGKKEDNLIKICQKGQLLNHVRQSVEADVKRQETEDQERKTYHFPSSSQLAFEIDRYNKNPDMFPNDRYAYDPDSGMTMMCAKKRMLAKFYESSSEKELQKQVKIAESRNEMLYKLPSKPNFNRHHYTPSILQLIANAPPNTFIEPNPPAKYNPMYTHLGLIDDVKRKAYNKVVKKLEKRDKNVNFPNELTDKVEYGPVKELPSDYKIPIPEHLSSKYPATHEEMKTVEEAMIHDKLVQRARRSQGRASFGKPVAKSFTKSLLQPEADVEESLKDEDFEEYAQYVSGCNIPMVEVASAQRISYNNNEVGFVVPKILGRISSDHNSRRTIKPQLLLSTAWEHFSTVENRASKIESSRNVSQFQSKASIAKSSQISKSNAPSTSRFSSKVEDEMYFHAVDSRESLPYSDIAFSDIEHSIKNIPGVRGNTLYKALVLANMSSSEESAFEVEDSSSTAMETLEGSSTEETETANEETDWEDKLHLDEDDEYKVFKEMFLQNLKNQPPITEDTLQTPIQSATFTNNKSENIREQNTSSSSTDTNENDVDEEMNYNEYWEKVFETKMLKEKQRQERVSNAKEYLISCLNEENNKKKQPRRNKKDRLTHKEEYNYKNPKLHPQFSPLPDK